MVTVPGEDRDVSFVRDFYETNRTVIVVAQVTGLMAAACFLVFARGLQRQDWVEVRPWVIAGGAAVALAAVLTGVPPLALCVVAGSGDAGMIGSLATASDLVDVVLFTAITAFAVAIALAVHTTWLRVVSVIVALVSAARAVLLLSGGHTLEVVAPVTFIVLVLCLTITSWRSQPSTDG